MASGVDITAKREVWEFKVVVVARIEGQGDCSNLAEGNRLRGGAISREQ
jgi:hypothetical protein